MTKIIVEIASCHNGDLELAKALIKSAAENGADIVKFQDWKAQNVPDNDSDKKRYEQYEFKDEWYPEIIQFCKDNNVEFLTTCFNANRAKYLSDLGLKRIKLASISLTNLNLLIAASTYFNEVIFSVAMHSEEEVRNAIKHIRYSGTVMHCVANYPTNPEDANLEKINTLRELWSDVGYSDHSLDLDVAKAALCMDIKYLEKHFTLSRALPQIPHQMYEGGPLVTTHEISIEPRELKELADWRDKVSLMKGNGSFKTNGVEVLIRERYNERYGT
jgi:N,N'-diacetyllegionaminate synthase